MAYEFAMLNTQHHDVVVQPVQFDMVTPAEVDSRTGVWGEPADSNHTVERNADGDPTHLTIRVAAGYVGPIDGKFVTDADRGDGVKPIELPYHGEIGAQQMPEAAGLVVSGTNVDN